MTSFTDQAVTVEVPATSANLGPGFDCLGIALDFRDVLTARVSSETSIVVEGEGAAEVPLDESHLVLRALRAGLDHLGAAQPAIDLRCRNVIPHSRGLGSSSAAIVGGLALARALVDVGEGAPSMDDEEMLAVANAIEGHPDNVAPACLGGFVVSGQDRARVWGLRTGIDPRIGARVFVPPEGVETKLARGLLPESISHGEATANTGRAALLVAALAGHPEHLLRATEDFLHQKYRETAMPHSYALVERLRAMACPAVISGAGPTVLAFTGPGLPEVAGFAPAGWRELELSIATSGVRVVD
jgi:homoserine kinase